MKIAVDAMGGDFAPEQIVFGAVRAARKYQCEIVLVGDETAIRSVLEREKGWEDLNITIHHASEVIGMGEHPADAVRTKKDASVVVATQLVKDGECDAVLSAGSTGAAVTAAQLILKRIRGIGRPTIATPMPTPKGVTLLLDSGANVDSKPEHLVQSGMMGALYAEHVFGKENPRVGLLNIGEEETKGNEQAKATYQLLKTMRTINFIGNAEGRDVPKGNFDVVICDGFVGNIVLKFAEGLAKTILKLIKEAIKDGGIFAKLGALLLMPTLKKLGKRLDVTEYGGAPLLGVNGCCIISHGSSNAKSICSAIGVANEYVKSNVLGHIRDALTKEEMLAKDGENR
ncbi:MAG: phosphate acyltransferase PlsX [Selenomonadaceae bacterium]|nr:phosphate acyltransferase PlsX [Selenomonadaceae bacterium]MBQ1915307.1 phosphate acyltransferase PlsX [Selenomonadaceae bacterium]MBQ3972482.1 phosphate acyltransferase PlsX [Selenomonadaceae bacterium]